MTNIIRMNQARQLKALHKVYNWPNYGIKSHLQLIDEGCFLRGEIGQEPSVKWNRRKFNNMDYSEQKEYERKLDTMVPEYRLYTSETSFYPVPKLVYDYFISLHPVGIR